MFREAPKRFNSSSSNEVFYSISICFLGLIVSSILLILREDFFSARNKLYFLHTTINEQITLLAQQFVGGPPGQAGTVPFYGISRPGPGESCGIPPQPGRSVGYLPGAPVIARR